MSLMPDIRLHPILFTPRRKKNLTSGRGHIRTLLIHCARAVLRSVAHGKNPFGGGALDQWVRNLLERRGKNKTAVALAAKLARVAWAMLAKGTSFQKTVNAA